MDVEAAYAAGLITSRPGNPRKFRRLPITPRKGSQDVGHIIADGGNLNGAGGVCAGGGVQAV